MRPVVLGALLALALLPASQAAAAGEEAGAEGSTTVDRDTVWEGTRDLKGTVFVEAGATLVVRPGSTLRFPASGNGPEPARLIVRGQLLALGTPEEPITFTGAGQQAGAWGGIVLDKANDRQSRLRHCRIEFAVQGVTASLSTLLVENCVLASNLVGARLQQKVGGALFDCDITGNRVGLRFIESTGFLAEKCRIRENVETGVDCLNGSSPVLRNCEVSSNGAVGISCVMGSSPLVENCLISGQERGLHVELNSRPLIRGNEIRDNGTGVRAEKRVFPTIEGNLITDNNVGLYCNFSAYPRVRSNAIFGNREWALQVGDNQSTGVEKMIPYRNQGAYYETAPEGPQFLPAKTRKYQPLGEMREGSIDARANWWGEEGTTELARIGDEGNASFVEDREDKPTVRYGDRDFPRDRVSLSPWEEARPPEAGRAVVPYSGLRGKVLVGGEPLAGAYVHAYAGADAFFKGEGLGLAVTSADGAYSLNLGPGRYFLVVKKFGSLLPGAEPGTGDLFGYYGGNPVAVGRGEWVEANIQAVLRREVADAPVDGLADGRIEGLVLGPKGPEAGASLYVYPGPQGDFRGPDLFGPQGAVAGGTDAEGRFAVEVPPGSYALVAVKRKGGGGLGPLVAGDLHGWFDGNPVVVGEGKRVTLTLQMVEKLRDVPRPAAGLAGIRGTIRDASGKVPPGAFAFASGEANLAGGMPPFRSRPVGEDGAFQIDLPGAGTYYVGARTGHGGPPLPGEYYGVHGGAEPAPVAVEAGSVTADIDVTVEVVR